MIVVEESFLFNAILWTLMDVILRGVRASLQQGEKQLLIAKKSFGGIALMVVGDPLQGSPVGDNETCLDRKSKHTIKSRNLFADLEIPLLFLFRIYTNLLWMLVCNIALCKTRWKLVQ